MLLLLALACTKPSLPEAQPTLDRGENGVWLRRQWIQGGPEVEGREAELRQALVQAARSKGITRLYPFLGPMNEQGHPGWRSDAGIQPYDAETAGTFFQAVRAADPNLLVLPWTGGVLRQDVRFGDEACLAGFTAHAAKIVELGAHGVQLNVEPLPSYTPGFIELLDATRAAMPEGAVLSVAAYPPTTPLHDFPDVHWTIPFLKDVCLHSDELAVMAYDTALRDRATYQGLVATWTEQLAANLPPPDKGGCVWLVGVPAYEDDVGCHRPDIETVDVALRGVRDGLGRKAPEHFRGVAVYASWTTDETEWAYYDELWRGQPEADHAPLPDFDL